MPLLLPLLLCALPDTLERRFTPPEGFTRVEAAPGSFAAWLRALPLEPAGAPVQTFDGKQVLAGDDPRLAAVVSLDVGNRDLQQCADTAIRLHAEWLFDSERALEVTHHLTNGDVVPFARWAKGERPTLGKKHVQWALTSRPQTSHATFRQYLDFIFLYAGTTSLAAEARPVARGAVAGGDVFVMPNPKSTGHAVVVLDLASDPAGHKVALLGQGFMPAQSLHVLAHGGSAWFSLEGPAVETPFWKPFPLNTLRRQTP